MVRISPQGLEIDNSDITRPLTGNIVRAEVADLDQRWLARDLRLRQITWSRDAGRADRLRCQPKKSLSEIYLPAISENAKAAEGYQGEDEFAVVENALVRRFPVYDSADAGAGQDGEDAADSVQIGGWRGRVGVEGG